jgi:hypothetical protein
MHSFLDRVLNILLILLFYFLFFTPYHVRVPLNFFIDRVLHNLLGVLFHFFGFLLLCLPHLSYAMSFFPLFVFAFVFASCFCFCVYLLLLCLLLIDRDLNYPLHGRTVFPLFFSRLFLPIYFYRDLHNLLSVLGMEEQPLPLLWTADFILGKLIFYFFVT